MNRRRKLCVMFTAGALALVCIASMDSRAQDKQNGGGFDNTYTKKTGLKPLPPGGPTPRTADGHPDFSGIWFTGTLGTEDATLVGSYGESDPAMRAFDPKVTPEEKPSFTPWGEAKLKEMMYGLDPAILRQYGITYSGATSVGEPNIDKLPLAQKKAYFDVEIARLSRDCVPVGAPGIGNGGHGMQFVQTAGQLVELVDANHDYRVISTDNRPHTEDPDPTFNGEERAHWEGDVLVIDTIAVDERVWNSATWRYHSDQEHVIERYSRPSKNYLIHEVTIEDPKMLTKPWHSAPHRFTLSITNEPLGEWYCGVEPNEALEHIKALRQQLGK